MDKDSLIKELRAKIIYALNIQGIDPEDITADTPLFNEDGLDLDSVDALELVVLMEKEYGVSIDDKKESKAVFANLGLLADYIISKKA